MYLRAKIFINKVLQLIACNIGKNLYVYTSIGAGFRGRMSPNYQKVNNIIPVIYKRCLKHTIKLIVFQRCHFPSNCNPKTTPD